MFFHAILLTHTACLQGQSDGVPKRKNKKWCQELFWHAKNEDVMFALQNRRRANERVTAVIAMRLQVTFYLQVRTITERKTSIQILLSMSDKKRHSESVFYYLWCFYCILFKNTSVKGLYNK